jgi:hypothetical protein
MNYKSTPVGFYYFMEDSMKTYSSRGGTGGYLMMKGGGSDSGTTSTISSGTGHADFKFLAISNEYDGSLGMFTNAAYSTSQYYSFQFIIQHAGSIFPSGSPVFSQSVSNNGQQYVEMFAYNLTQGTSYDIYFRLNRSNGYDWFSLPSWTMTCTLSVPTNLTFNSSDFTMSTTSSESRVAYLWGEVDSTANPRFQNYTPEERQYFYSICLNSRESVNWRFNESFPTVLKRWTKPVVRYKSTFLSSAVGNSSYYNDLLSSNLNELNSIISGSGVTLQLVTTGDYDIEVTFGTASELGFVYPDFRYNGQWFANWDGNGVLYSGWIKLATDPIDMSFQAIMHEEVAQVLGAGNDGNAYKNSCFYENIFSGRPTTYPDIDQKVLKLLYCEDLPVGGSSAAIARMINCMAVSGSSLPDKKLYFNKTELKPNTQYKFQAWSVAIGSYYADLFSLPSGYSYFTTPVDPFIWKYAGYNSSGTLITGPQKLANHGFYISANDEWNKFQIKINQALSDKGLSQFSFFNYYHGDNSFTVASPNGNFYYYFFNQIRNAILDLNPNANVPASKVSGSIIYASDLNQLVDAFNNSV